MLRPIVLLFFLSGVNLAGSQDWKSVQWQLSPLDHCIHCAQPLLSMVLGLIDFDLKNIASSEFLDTKCRELEEQRQCLETLHCWDQLFGASYVMATLDYVCKKREDMTAELSCWRDSNFQTGAITCVSTIVFPGAPQQQRCEEITQLKACIVPQAEQCSSRAGNFIRGLLSLTLNADGCPAQ